MGSKKINKAIAFILPLNEFVPIPPGNSFSITKGGEKLDLPKNGVPVVDDNAEKFSKSVPNGDHDFVFIKVINGAQVGMSQFAVNHKITESVLKIIAPSLAPGDKEGEKFQAPDKYVTTLVMQTPLIDLSKSSVGSAFNTCLESANHLISAACYVEQESFYPLNEVTLPGMILFLTRDIAEREWTDRGIYLTPHGNDMRATQLKFYSKNDMHKITAGLAANVLDQPSNQYNLLLSTANKMHFKLGDFRTAVIMYSTADQVALDQFILVAWWETGVTPDEAALRFNNLPGLAGRLKNYYSPVFKGSGWTLVGDGELARWHRKTANIRGRCVHAGYSPTHSEVDEVLNASGKLMDFLIAKLSTNKKFLPKTFALCVGDQSGSQAEAKMFSEWKQVVMSKLQNLQTSAAR